MNEPLSDTESNGPIPAADCCHVTSPPRVYPQPPLEGETLSPWVPSPRLLPPRSRLVIARLEWGFRWGGLESRSLQLVWFRILRPLLFSKMQTQHKSTRQFTGIFNNKKYREAHVNGRSQVRHLLEELEKLYFFRVCLCHWLKKKKNHWRSNLN